MSPLTTSDLTGRVALITGAQRGIGLACAEAYVANGARVALADLPGSRVEAARDGLVGDGHSVHTVDVSDEASVAALVQEVVQRQGRIDVLVHCAGTFSGGPLLDFRVEEWDRLFAVNARGTFLMLRHTARAMIESGRGGRIVAYASNLGRMARLDKSGYSASKAAVIHLVRCAALELARHEITVNAICPGSTDTEMLGVHGDQAKIDAIVKGSIEQWRTGVPLGRLAEPEDQAALALFFATDAARYVTGQAWSVDGGQALGS